jgi:hypothetical protein
MSVQIPISNELLTLLRSILEENKSVDEWKAIESDDMFQSENYSGGFDATENAFCFSFYEKNGAEYWFQLSFDDIQRIVESEKGEVDMRPAG